MSRAAGTNGFRRLQEIALDVLWRQWRALGGSATVRASWHGVVDPEALVLASLFLTDREPRLADILSSWVELNAPLLSAQRLRNAQKRFPPAIGERVTAFVSQARVLQKHPRWHLWASDAGPGATDTRPEVLRATRAPRTGTGTLMLRLRAALGVGVKADVLTAVLGSDRPVSVRDLVDALGYTDVATRQAADDLAYAGFVVATAGRPTRFTAPYAQWQALLNIEGRPTWSPWNLWFALATDLLGWQASAESKGVSDYVFDVGCRERLDAHSEFLRLAAHELHPSVLTESAHSSMDAINAIADWACRRADEAASPRHPHLTLT